MCKRGNNGVSAVVVTSANAHAMGYWDASSQFAVVLDVINEKACVV